MIPKNFSRENFTSARNASVFHCIVWFDLEQKDGTPYTSWRNELYKVNSFLKVVAHASAYKALKDMLTTFITPNDVCYRPFTRAEIYENFFGTTLYIHDGTKQIDTDKTFEPVFITASDLKLPGKHRLVDSFVSKQYGTIQLDRADVIKHLNNNWKYYHANYKQWERKDRAA